MSNVRDRLVLVILYISERMITVPSEQQLRDQIIEKAWADAEFKKQLLADPKKAIQDAFGVTVPDEYKLEVLEEKDDNYYLVLPQNPATTDAVDDGSGVRWP